MSTVANLYDNGPISPICRIKENLSVWTAGQWKHYNVTFIEPLPRSRPTTVEMVVASGATTLAANGTIAKQVVAILALAEMEFTHLRWEPIDDVEGVLWEQAGTGRFVTRGVQARVDRWTHFHDPYLATSTFFILGKDRDMNLEVRNPNPVAIPQARFVFWGFRYLLNPLSSEPANTTWVPAEGR